MKLTEKYNKKLYHIVLAACAMAILFLFAIYCMSPADTSDYVEGVIWADETLHSGRLLSTEFVYGYAMPFGSNIIMLPFVALFGTSQLANSCGMVVIYIVLILTCILFTTALTTDKIEALFGAALMTLAFRSYIGQDQLHHILHYLLGHISLAGTWAMVIRVIKNKGCVLKWVWITMAFYVIWSGSNGWITLFFSVIPVVGALGVACFLTKDHKRKLQCIVFLLVMSVIGLLLYRICMHGVNESTYIEDSGSFVFKSISEWMDNLRKLPEDLLYIFVNDNPAGKKITEPEGIEVAARVAWTFLVGLIPIPYIIKVRKRELSDISLYIFLSNTIVWIICLCQYIFFRGAEKRMLYNAVMSTFMIAAVLYLQSDYRNGCTGKKWKYVELAAAIVLVLFAASFVLSANWDPDKSLTDELESKGLHYGLSTFWHANYNTVQSSGRVKIRSCLIDTVKGTVQPHLLQSNVGWYNQNQLNDSEWFILLESGEYDSLKEGSNNAYLFDNCIEDSMINGFHVLVYTSDMWDSIIHKENYSFALKDDSWSEGCVTENHERRIMDGGLSYGPGIHIDKDTEYRVTLSGESLSHAAIDIYSLQEDIHLQPEYISTSDYEVVFDFSSEVDLSALEVTIRNVDSDEYLDDIIINRELIEAL